VPPYNNRATIIDSTRKILRSDGNFIILLIIGTRMYKFNNICQYVK
jgi:hypothetical protein